MHLCTQVWCGCGFGVGVGVGCRANIVYFPKHTRRQHTLIMSWGLRHFHVHLQTEALHAVHVGLEGMKGQERSSSIMMESSAVSRVELD